MDLQIPHGNRLEALKSDRAGQYSIRINNHWRVCFRWTGENALDVEITADTAIRLSWYFGTTPGFWMNMQSRFDLESLVEEKGEELARIRRRPEGVLKAGGHRTAGSLHRGKVRWQETVGNPVIRCVSAPPDGDYGIAGNNDPEYFARVSIDPISQTVVWLS